jgi:hypothetical protein
MVCPCAQPTPARRALRMEPSRLGSCTLVRRRATGSAARKSESRDLQQADLQQVDCMSFKHQSPHTQSGPQHKDAHPYDSDVWTCACLATREGAWIRWDQHGMDRRRAIRSNSTLMKRSGSNRCGVPPLPFKLSASIYVANFQLLISNRGPARPGLQHHCWFIHPWAVCAWHYLEPQYWKKKEVKEHRTFLICLNFVWFSSVLFNYLQKMSKKWHKRMSNSSKNVQFFLKNIQKYIKRSVSNVTQIEFFKNVVNSSEVWLNYFILKFTETSSKFRSRVRVYAYNMATCMCLKD